MLLSKDTWERIGNLKQSTKQDRFVNITKSL